MRNKKTSILAVVLAMVMMFTLMIIPNVDPVKADDFKVIKFASNMVISTGAPDVWVDLGTRWKEGKKLKVTSSNKKVIDIYESSYPVLDVKKAGTVTVTFKTASKTYKSKIKVLTYKNPVKGFKIGGKGVRNKFNEYSSSWMEYKGKQPYIKVSPSKGWTLKKITYKAYKYDYETDEYKTYTKTVKNNKSVKLKGKSWEDQFIIVTLYNKSKNLTEDLEMYVERG